MRLVVIESPYAGDVETNLAYVRACMRHSLSLGEAPFASQALYTQPGVLDDNVPEERQRGIKAGFDWGWWSDAVVFYLDRGWSPGMTAALTYWRSLSSSSDQIGEIRTRTLGAPWSDLAPSDAEMLEA